MRPAMSPIPRLAQRLQVFTETTNNASTNTLIACAVKQNGHGWCSLNTSCWIRYRLNASPARRNTNVGYSANHLPNINLNPTAPSTAAKYAVPRTAFGMPAVVAEVDDTAFSQLPLVIEHTVDCSRVSGLITPKCAIVKYAESANPTNANIPISMGIASFISIFCASLYKYPLEDCAQSGNNPLRKMRLCCLCAFYIHGGAYVSSFGW